LQSTASACQRGSVCLERAVMAALEKNDPPGEGVKWRFPSVHPEGRKFAVIAAAITGVIALVGWHTLAWLMLGVTVWVLAFFRDPIRTTPRNERAPKELVAELGEGHFTRVSIFMSVFDVHINRTPIAGTIKQVVYIAGKFLNADLDKASEDNERQHFVVERNDGAKVGFTQIAGLVARRIVPFVKAGDIVAAGPRIGLIRFGSRGLG
jgi:phosphatidylserine decarboxylase